MCFDKNVCTENLVKYIVVVDCVHFLLLIFCGFLALLVVMATLELYWLD